MPTPRVVDVQLVRSPAAVGPPGCPLVRLVAETGASGLGEVCICPDDDCADALDWLADAALGREVTSREAVWQRLASEAEGWEGDEHHIAAAAAGIDTAMWDLAASHVGVPVAALMGGGVRARTELCADCGDLLGGAAVQVAAGLLKAGIRTFSFTLDGGDKGLRDGIRELRRVLGVDPLVVLEVTGGAQTMDEAVTLGAALDQAEPYWVEGLLPEGQWSELARVRGAVGSPTGAGSSVMGTKRFWRILESQCADVVKARLALCEGPTGALRIADAAEMRGLRMALRAGDSLVSVMAAAAVCSARGGVTPLQLPASALGLLSAARPALVKDGFMLPNGEPGLGLGSVVGDGVEVLASFTLE